MLLAAVEMHGFAVSTAASMVIVFLVLLGPAVALIADKRDARLVGIVVLLVVLMLVTWADKFS